MSNLGAEVLRILLRAAEEYEPGPAIYVQLDDARWQLVRVAELSIRKGSPAVLLEIVDTSEEE